MSIAGETIDYGPCAFMDAYDPATVFSSIDRARPLRLRQPAADRALEPDAAGGTPAAAACPTTRTRRSARRKSARRLRARVRVGLSRRPATQARPVHGARGRRRAGAGPAGRDGDEPGRFHADLPAPERRRARSGRRRRSRGTCSPIPRPTTTGPRAGGSGSPRSRRTPADAAGRDAGRQPGLHPAQPPGRGGDRGRREPGRLRAVRGAAGGAVEALSRTSRPSPATPSRRRPHERVLQTFCGT